jgi:deoxycytidylate deaminase
MIRQQMAASDTPNVPAALPEPSSFPDPELFIGLVFAVGTDHNLISRILEESLRELGYQTENVRLVSHLRAFPKFRNLPTNPVDDYIRSHQKAGNWLREQTERCDAVAVLGLSGIQDARINVTNAKQMIASRHAYVLRSLKTPDEVRTLRDVYGDAFFLIGAFAPRNTRRRYLAGKIAESRSEFQVDQYLSTAEELIQTDQEEIGNRFGQNVRNTFYRSDIFVDASDPERLREAIRRALELVFGNTFHTPTKDEYGMFHAQAAALRSAELGRQVGAAVATPEGDIIAVGTNEVPKAGGGLYWAGDTPDHRECVRGGDSNDEHKRAVLEDLLNRLRKQNWLAASKDHVDIRELASEALDPIRSPELSSAQLTNLIEFGRAVHAEMAAITDAARRGVSVKGATMYITTFPCHGCAKHIVAAGIGRVVYIAPYAKSLATQLYPDSIAADGAELNEGQIRFEPFVGVAPTKYMQLFTMTERKTRDGKVKPFVRASSVPRLVGSPRAYLRQEKIAIASLQEIIEKKKLMEEVQ